MTDKEQIINNFEKDINVPSKEQIIIDGVDVKNCRRRIGKNNYCRYFKRLCSENNFNCVWKQLARKTQECEGLKEKNTLLESQMAFNLSEMGIRLGNEVNRSETLLKELKRFDKIKDEFREMSEKLKSKNDRYRKALEEIEKELKEDVYCESQECGCDDFEECLNCVKTQILDIINKAKEEEC